MTQKEQGIPVEAGKELDALVAEKVMGYVWRRFMMPVAETQPPCKALIPPGGAWFGTWGDLQGDEVEADDAAYFVSKYSTDIMKAWEVVHRLNALGCNVGAWELVPFRGADELRSRCKVRKWDADGESLLLDFECVADSAPHAICLAALNVVKASCGNPVVGEPVHG